MKEHIKNHHPTYMLHGTIDQSYLNKIMNNIIIIVNTTNILTFGFD